MDERERALQVVRDFVCENRSYTGAEIARQQNRLTEDRILSEAGSHGLAEDDARWAVGQLCEDGTLRAVDHRPHEDLFYVRPKPP